MTTPIQSLCEKLEPLATQTNAEWPGPWEDLGEGRGVWHVNAKIGGLNKCADIRGWGYLTGQGHGALGLSEDEAIERQRRLNAFIVAAQPSTILDLISHIRTLEAQLDHWRATSMQDTQAGEKAEAQVQERDALLAKEERDHERTIEERDRAQDALQNTHIALGGDGEWVARLPNTPPPDSGDLHEDVPVLAAAVKEMRDEAMEENQRLRTQLEEARRQRRTPGTVEVCGRHRDDRCGNYQGQKLPCHFAQPACPLRQARSATSGEEES